MADKTVSWPEAEELRCYRHPDRETAVSCSRCGRSICPSCMSHAAVGIHCPECARGGSSVAAARLRGARGSIGSALGVQTDMPLATVVLIAVCVLVFIADSLQGVGGSSAITTEGALFGPAVADGEWWRLITAAFLHANIIHIAFNMILLWWLGSALEQYAGTGRLLLIYFSAVLWGSAGALLMSPDVRTVGASGGVFGLMAAVYLLERQRGVQLLGGSILALLVLNLAITFALPGISVGGHVGGLLGGAAAGFVLSGFGRGHLAYGRLRPEVMAAAAAIPIAGIVAGVVFVERGVTWMPL